MSVSVAVVYGTRPEAIKLAPLIAALRVDDRFRTTVIATGQHADLVTTVENTFGITPDVRLERPRASTALGELAASILASVAQQLQALKPDLVVVHGDTTTASSAALAAHLEHIPVGHVEAGLRSGDLFSPWPEEANRRIIGQLASLHLAPTERARAHLLAEGVPDSLIVVTGNTVVDALLMTVRNTSEFLSPVAETGFQQGHRTILFTAHRRESWEHGLTDTARALNEVLEQRPDTLVLAPLHPNPVVQAAVVPYLGGHPRAVLSPPLDYPDFCLAMARAYCIVTDSGGIQEEAPSVNTPVLVTRDTTERDEVITAGVARLVGTQRSDVRGAVLTLLDDPNVYESMRTGRNPYGDGSAAQRCVEAIHRWSMTWGGVAS